MLAPLSCVPCSILRTKGARVALRKRTCPLRDNEVTICKLARTLKQTRECDSLIVRLLPDRHRP